VEKRQAYDPEVGMKESSMVTLDRGIPPVLQGALIIRMLGSLGSREVGCVRWRNPEAVAAFQVISDGGDDEPTSSRERAIR
jgi:hypothetical protein